MNSEGESRVECVSDASPREHLADGRLGSGNLAVEPKGGAGIDAHSSQTAARVHRPGNKASGKIVDGTRKVYDRADRDYYREPAWAVHGLLNVERFAGTIWDPACGSGNIVEVAWDRRHGKFGGPDTVAIGSDLIQRYRHAKVCDFLSGEDWQAIDHVWGAERPHNIIMNPPFKKGIVEPFIDRTLRLVPFKVAVLLPLTFLEGIKRRAWFRGKSLARVWVSVERISMPPGDSAVEAKGGMKCFAWFVFDHDHQGPPQLGWMEKPK